MNKIIKILIALLAAAVIIGIAAATAKQSEHPNTAHPITNEPYGNIAVPGFN